MRIRSAIAFLLVTVLICCLFWLSWTGRLPYPSTVKTLEARGQFGDSFGVVNAIISSFALIGLLVTVAMQQKQLTEQGDELKRQAKIDAEGRQREEVNQYEELLFRLLGFYLDSVDAVSILREGKRITGREALSQNLQDMQKRLRSRKLNFVPEAILSRVKDCNATQVQMALYEYVSMETFRVIQYSVVYQRRVIASLLTLLRHMEQRCPAHVDVETYRAVVSAQITHVEVQYIFAMMLIYANEDDLRALIHQSGFFQRDSPPYNFSFHRFLYNSLWSYPVGNEAIGRVLPFDKKKSAELRAQAKGQPLASLLKKYGIREPITPESLSDSPNKTNGAKSGLNGVRGTKGGQLAPSLGLFRSRRKSHSLGSNPLR